MRQRVFSALVERATRATEGSLACSDSFAFPSDTRLFIVLALFELLQYASFFALLLKSADRTFDRLVIFNAYSCHVRRHPLPGQAK